MPLVLAEDVPDGAAPLADRGDDLLGLGDGDARVVLALDDQERHGDLRGVGQRGDPVEVLAHLRVALVAVLGAAEVAAVALGVLQEGDEVRDPHDVDART